MIVLLLIIVGVCVLAATAATFGRRSRPDEVERFHRARAMTTEWSRHHPAHLGPLDREPETVDHA